MTYDNIKASRSARLLKISAASTSRVDSSGVTARLSLVARCGAGGLVALSIRSPMEGWKVGISAGGVAGTALSLKLWATSEEWSRVWRQERCGGLRAKRQNVCEQKVRSHPLTVGSKSQQENAKTSITSSHHIIKGGYPGANNVYMVPPTLKVPLPFISEFPRSQERRQLLLYQSSSSSQSSCVEKRVVVWKSMFRLKFYLVVPKIRVTTNFW